MNPYRPLPGEALTTRLEKSSVEDGVRSSYFIIDCDRPQRKSWLSSLEELAAVETGYKILGNTKSMKFKKSYDQIRPFYTIMRTTVTITAIFYLLYLNGQQASNSSIEEDDAYEAEQEVSNTKKGVHQQRGASLPRVSFLLPQEGMITGL